MLGSRISANAGLPVRAVPLVIEWRRNPQGFRERSFDELPPDARLTLVVGDSFCFGQGVRVQERFSEVLGRRLAESSLEWADGRQAIVNLCELGLDILGALDALRSAAEEQGVAFVDLLPTFEGLDERALQVHPVTDFHPNHLAHRRAAEVLLETLTW